jgi:hypothetical protein
MHLEGRANFCWSCSMNHDGVVRGKPAACIHPWYPSSPAPLSWRHVRVFDSRLHRSFLGRQETVESWWRSESHDGRAYAGRHTLFLATKRTYAVGLLSSSRPVSHRNGRWSFGARVTRSFLFVRIRTCIHRQVQETTMT